MMDEPLIPKDQDPLAPPEQQQQQQEKDQHLPPAILHERAQQQIRQVERLYLDREEEEDDAAADKVYWKNGKHSNNDDNHQDLIESSLLPTATTPTIKLSVVWGAVVNLCSATLGAGILSLPYSFYQAGLIAGIILLIAAAIATATSISLLTQAVQYYSTHHHHLQLNTYERLTQHLLGLRCKLLVEICLVVFCGGCAVAYCIAVGDILQLSGLLLKGNKAISMLLVWTVAMLPLSLLKTMKSLQCSSAIGMASIATLVFAAAVHLLQDCSRKNENHVVPPDNNHENSTNTTKSTTYWWWDETNNDSMMRILWEIEDNGTNTTVTHDWKSLLWPANGTLSVIQACPIILFAFSCQVNVCAIFEELPSCQHDEPCHHHNKLHLMQRVTLYAVLVCATLYCSISCLGLADFGAQLDPNILNNYAPPVGIMQVACGSMAAAVIMAFPLNIFPARATLTHVWNDLHENEDEREPLLREPNTTLTAALLEDLEREAATQQEEACDEQAAGATMNDILLTPRVHFASPESTTLPPETTTMEADDNGGEEESWQQHIILTLLLAGSALCLALVVPDISVVFGLLGGTTSSVLGFCIPGALGLRLVRDQRGAEASFLWGTWLASWILLIGGLGVGIVTTVVTVYTTFFQISKGEIEQKMSEFGRNPS